MRNLDSGRVTRGAGPNLQVSIEAANPFETLGISGRCNGTFLVSKGLTFQGIPTAEVPLPTLDAHHAGVVLTTGQGPVTIDGLRIVNGDRNDFGGGIEGHGTLRVIDSAIRNDRAVYGGGIFSAGPLIVGGTTVISDNTARLGAGVYAAGTMLVRDASTVHDNVARRGGGIFAEGALTLRDQASVSANYVSILGGGIFGVGPITMSNTSVVQGNTAGRTVAGSTTRTSSRWTTTRPSRATSRPSGAGLQPRARAAGVVFGDDRPQPELARRSSHRRVSHGLMSLRGCIDLISGKARCIRAIGA